MKLKLNENEQIRTVTIRVKSERDQHKIRRYFYKYKHFENMLLILLKQNYDLFCEGKDSNDFALLTNYRVMRAVICDTQGGKDQEQVVYIKTKYRNHQLMQDIIKQAKELKQHNLAMLINEVKSNFKSFFSKIKQGDTNARPPKAKKLKNLNKFTIELDFNSWSFKKKDRLGINLNKKMFYIYPKHQPFAEVIGAIEKVQSVAIHFANGEIYLKISYRHLFCPIENPYKKYCGVDIGINNLAALVVDDQATQSLILCGKPLSKSPSSSLLNISNTKQLTMASAFISSMNAILPMRCNVVTC